MKFKINWDGGVFAVPDAAADCLKLASGKAVKVLLYILKNKSSDADFAEIAKAVNVSEEDVEDALSYWQQVGVILSGSAPLTAAAKEVPAVPKRIPEKQDISPARSRERSSKMMTPAEIAERVNGSAEIKFLFGAAEATLGKVLTNTEQRTFIWLHDYYGIAPDLLLMIMDLAVSQNKASIGFIEKIAEQWHSDGINTHEQAEREILRMENYYSLEGQVKAKLGLDRTLSPTEKKFISEWAEKNIGIDLILYAYEKTIDNIGKVKFSYMNTILLDWHGKGCFTAADVKKTEKSVPKKAAAPQDGGEHSYNLDLLLEHAMNTTPKIKG